MSVGYLADSFDLLNVRDLDLIAQARERCSHLILGVYADEFVEQTTGRTPVVPLHERMAVLSHVRGVAEVVVHDPTTAGADPTVLQLVSADGAAPAPVDGILLTPARASRSAVLRNALRPVATEPDGEAVA